MHHRALCCLFLLVAGCADRTTALDPVLHRMQQRLELMHDVARWKWNENRPIADPQRERELLDRMGGRAAAWGLDPDWVRRFFAAQIEAAKLVQQADHDRWKKEARGPFTGAPDLKALRQRIDALNDELLDALVTARPALRNRELLRRRAAAILKGDGTEAALAPLVEPGAK